jgi:hypothetical protein
MINFECFFYKIIKVLNMEMNSQQKIARITDILEQIENLNHQIDLHKNNDGDNASIEQYEFIKSDFVKELNDLIFSFNLQIEPIAA